MWEIEDHFKVRIGGNTYIDVQSIIEYQGTPLMSLRRDSENGYLGIDFTIYDKGGNHVATVKRSEIYRGNKDDYQIVGSATRYTLTEKATGRVICDIKRYADAHPNELDVSVKLYTPSGFLFDASPNETNIGGNTFTNCTFAGGRAAIAIG